jgi:hypothetical protein
MLMRLGILVCSVLLLAGCFTSDQRHLVTKQMGWQCTGTADTTKEPFTAARFPSR